ncbi:MAG: GH1 family beta-glucosidase [Rhizobacter sp.]
MSSPTFRFPDTFAWGSATSAYQIEGSADVDGRTPSIWDTFSKTPGRVENGDTGDIACDSYRRVDDDIALLKAMGATVYRFSISWSRVMPQGRGAVNPAGIAYYRRLVDGLRAAGIAPMATLYHWDLPQCLQDEGGWLNRQTAEDFAAYADAMFDAFGETVPYWFTINEPWCVSFLSHAMGQHAPGERDLQQALTVAHHTLLGHGLAVKAFRARRLAAKIGIAPNVDWREPFSQHPDDVAACERGLDWFNRWFLDPVYRGRYPEALQAHYARLGAHVPIQAGDLALISQPTDMLGINFYTGSHTRARTTPLPHDPNPDTQAKIDRVLDGEGVDVAGFARTDIGWDIFPDAFYKVLLWLRDEYGNPPVFITENGACDNTGPLADGQVHDTMRTGYYRRHLIAMNRALRSGCDIRGYTAWSLLDNFEWAFGYGKRFGLVHVDFATQVRTPKDSFHWFQRVIANGGFDA